MKFPIFASFIVFIVWLTFQLKKAEQEQKHQEDSFWERESRANSVRKKSLDDLPYIKVPTELLPDEASLTDAETLESLHILSDLANQPIVNLNGISNTEVKLTYGTANITVLSEYDANFETFSKHIYLLCQKLYDAGRREEAKALLERTVTTGTDVSGHFILLARIYKEENHPEKIDALLPLAEKLHSISKKKILTELENLRQSF